MSRPPSSWHKDDHVERAGFKGLREFLQKLRVEAHQGPLPLDDGGEHVVMDQFFGGALKKVEGIEQAAV